MLDGRFGHQGLLLAAWCPRFLTLPFVVLERRWVVERSFGWLAHWGGLLSDRAGRLDVSAARIAFAATLSGVEALLNPRPIHDIAS